MIYLLWITSIVSLSICTLFNVKPTVYLLAVIVIMSIFAYLFDPILAWEQSGGSGMDGVRYYGIVDSFRTWGWNDEFFIGVPGSSVLLYFYSLFPNNHFMQLINFVIYMLIVMGTVYEIGKELSLANRNIVTGLFFAFLFTGFVSVINSIRYPMAVALFIFVLYLDVFRNHLWAKILYIVPVLTHPGSAMFVLIRFWARGNIAYSILLLMMLAIIFTISGYGIADILLSFSSFLSPDAVVLIGMADKASSYTSEAVYDIGLILRICIVLVSLLMLLISIHIIRIKYEIENKSLRLICNMGVIIPVFGMAALFTIEDSNISSRLVLSGFFAFYFSVIYLFLVKIYSQSKAKLFNINCVFWTFALYWFLIHAVKLDYKSLYHAFPW